MSRRILVVEDQADNRQILHDLLTSAGYEIVHAENGEAALASAAAQPPDLIRDGGRLSVENANS